jgi:cell wall-associated NlpC family hydrolase
VRRPPHRRPRRHGARTIIGSLLIAGLALAGVGIRQAHAETPGQKAERLRAQAVDVQATIDRMNDQVETVVEQYNGNQEALNATKARQTETARRLEQVRTRLGSAQNALGDRARSIYMHGPVSGLEQILEVRSVSDAVAIAHYQESASKADAQTIADVRQSRQDLTTVAASLATERGHEEALQSKLNQQRDDIEGKLADQRRLLESLSAGARQALAEEEQRQEQLRSQELQRRLAADRAAKAAAAARSQASGGSGGSGGSSGAQTEGVSSGGSGGSGGSMAAPAGPPAGSTGAPSAAAAQAIAFAQAQMGKPYVWGGEGPNGFDCSGLTMMAYKSAGISIPRVAAAQYTIGRQINDQSQLQPGDLVFFAHGSASSIHHVGIYIGNGNMIEAPFTGANVRIHTINRSGYFGATRPTG